MPMQKAPFQPCRRIISCDLRMDYFPMYSAGTTDPETSGSGSWSWRALGLETTGCNQQNRESRISLER